MNQLIFKFLFSMQMRVPVFVFSAKFAGLIS